MTRFLYCLLLVCAAPATAAPVTATAAPATAAPVAAAPVPAIPVPAATIRAALIDTANGIDSVILDEQGRARGDYDWESGRWSPYEVAWHSGQAIDALLAAYAVTGEARYLNRARQVGDYWVGLELTTGPFAGMINAAHGDRLGALINFTTVGNGTPGLFRLSRVTGDPRYADVATRAIDWLRRNTAVPGHAGLYYNILDPATGTIWTDRSPHHDVYPATIHQVARPNIEGSPFLDACHHRRDPAMCASHHDLARATLARQGDNGLWMDFEPNDLVRGTVHPRFNTWNAEAMLRAWREYRDPRFLQGALRTARANARMMRSDGSFDYSQTIDGTSGSASPTGSATAFAGLLWLGLRADGHHEFDQHIHVAARWLIANRFAGDHPDPNLRGLVLELRAKRDASGPTILQRDLGSLFAARFFEAYLAAFPQ